MFVSGRLQASSGKLLVDKGGCKTITMAVIVHAAHELALCNDVHDLPPLQLYLFT